MKLMKCMIKDVKKNCSHNYANNPAINNHSHNYVNEMYVQRVNPID